MSCRKKNFEQAETDLTPLVTSALGQGFWMVMLDEQSNMVAFFHFSMTSQSSSGMLESLVLVSQHI